MTMNAGITHLPNRVVRARRIRFDYPTASLDQHFVDGDLVMSHVVAYLSATLLIFVAKLQVKRISV
jgi:hypothetical protein